MKTRPWNAEMFIASHYDEFEHAGKTIWCSEVYNRSSSFLLFWHYEILLHQFSKIDVKLKKILANPAWNLSSLAQLTYGFHRLPVVPKGSVRWTDTMRFLFPIYLKGN